MGTRALWTTYRTDNIFAVLGIVWITESYFCKERKVWGRRTYKIATHMENNLDLVMERNLKLASAFL